ncbi:MAG: glutamate N-acetyltransferase/amino-acid N-acetyltransferase [Candidatus Promineifilaceae bacterium]|jgi:glutamate N-acetyltransferase/amino-acid N-acetyltransferase
MITKIENGTVTSPQGFQGGAAHCGVKNDDGKLDVSLVYSDRDCSAAGVFTLSQFVAPPVTIDRETLAQNNSTIRGVVTNSGNANAATGSIGLENGKRMQQVAADGLGCQAEQFLVMSTGVIGVQLPIEKIERGILAAVGNLNIEHGLRAAQAIMTTDTFVKQCAVEVELLSGVVKIGGMSKGAGMIHPNMATMLGVVTTDAAIGADLIKQMLLDASNVSFNRISVDGDTSTNDTVLMLANGASGVEINPSNQADFETFSHALIEVCTELAQLIVRDGEGATKFAEIVVSGAQSKADAHTVANTIAVSPLVKTALAGSDANWGRIMMAAGRAGVQFDQYATTLKIGNDGENWLTLTENGLPADYAESDAAAIFAEKDIHIWLDLAEGKAMEKVWTCDLTHGYVTINADYRT